MFWRKKSLVMNVVNTADLEEHHYHNGSEDVHTAAHISVLLENAVMGGVLLIGAYFAADTLRSVAIHTAVTKITPRVVIETAKK